MALQFALAGNPNSGKTTLFNRLTGASAHVGNWPGVTVEHRVGRYRDGETEIEIVDLPGVYSLAPYTPEEVVARDFIVLHHPDVIVNIVDATNLERNLYLTTQLLECDAPVVVALNMMDAAARRGITIDIKGLERALGVPVVPITAARGTGLPALMERAAAQSTRGAGAWTVLQTSVLGDLVAEIQDILSASGVDGALYYAVRLLEGDGEAAAHLSLGAKGGAVASAIARARARCPAGDVEAAVANLRYEHITDRLAGLVRYPRRRDGHTWTQRIDGVATSRILGLPLFFLVMFLLFHLTFTDNLLFVTGIPGPGVWLAGVVKHWVAVFAWAMAGLLTRVGAPDWACGLVLDGLFAGLGAVLEFLPLVLVLYLLISLLEDSGYMARAAFLMDRLLRRFGLTGRAFVPMIMGFGCSVPAIAATRTLDSQRDRRLAVLLIPFLSCGAKAPVYALMAPIFFPEYAEFVVAGIYLAGILVAVVAGIALKNTVLQGDDAPFIMELPPYRMPTAKSLAVHLRDKCGDFAKRVGTVIAAASVLIWFLSNFGIDGGFGVVEPNSTQSLLGYLGNLLRVFFLPLGFASGPDGWKAVVALLTGLVAREAIVSTMGQLYAGPAVLASAIGSAFTAPGALAFLAWCLLSTPCMAAVGAMANELNSRRWFWFAMAFHLVTAWTVSFLTFCTASLLL